MRWERGRPARLISVVVVLVGTAALAAQTRWRPLASGTTSSLRGLCVVNARLAWASGTGGAWLRTEDGGLHWRVGRVSGAARLDFRGVVAFDARVALLMSSGLGTASRIYRTDDGGAHWRLAWQARAPAAFLDAIAFWNRRRGLALGDPVGRRFLVLRTEDGGRLWRAAPAASMPPSLSNEGAFAASNTALAAGGAESAWFVTGGAARARIFATRDDGATWRAEDVPLARGAASGAFSLAACGGGHMAIVGGDYLHPERTAANAAYSDDGGRRWRASAPGPPDGYMSAVACVPGTRGGELLAVGPRGTDVALDGGRSWRRLNGGGFNAVAVARDGAAFAAGARGRTAVMKVRPSGAAQPR